jgi:molecular chaperone GrpE
MSEQEVHTQKNEPDEQRLTETTPAAELPAATESVVQLEELQNQVEQYKDWLLRKAAEFDNYKRRAETESSNIIRYATESLIEDLLPVVDDFERSLKHGKESNDYDALMKGIDLIYQKLAKVLDKRGVKAFETVGKEFNVDYHDALMQLPRTDLPPQTVVQEVEKGYMLGDKVLRHAKVVVSTLPTDENAGGTGTAGN